MADVHNPETRSYNMSQIKGKNTKPEMIVRNFLHSNGFRYRLHDKNLPGKPDIVLKKYKTIIDVRGCFWHLHSGCKYGNKITTPSEKITNRRETAVTRDKRKVAQWKKMDWNVIVIWADCGLEPRKKSSEKRKITLNELLINLKNHQYDN